MLTFLNVSVAYGQLYVLNEINLTVEKGSITSLIGANGAGKTTLLKTASGLIRPRSGIISFEGASIHSAPPHEIVNIGIVHIPEGRQVFNSLTVEDNLKLGSYLARAKEVRGRNMKLVYEMFPRLKERRKQLSETLSGGEQQMLAIGRGLMSVPRLLMLDEPSLGLAPLMVSRIFSVIREINQHGITILLVEQNVSYALKISHCGYLIENTRIVLSGSGQELSKNEITKKAYFGIR